MSSKLASNRLVPLMERKNPLLVALERRELTLLRFQELPGLALAQAACRSIRVSVPNGGSEVIGPNGLFIENEHASWSFHEVREAFTWAQAAGLSVVFRFRQISRPQLKPFLELGLQNIIFPEIRSVEDAERAIRSCLYRPDGNRPSGVGPDSDYFLSFDAYHAAANAQMVPILMIETLAAVNHIEKIAQLSNVRLLWVGPFDLADDMGVARGSREHAGAIKHVEDVAREHGISLGGNAGDLATALAMHERGYDVLTFGPTVAQQVAGFSEQLFRPEDLAKLFAQS